MKKKKIMWFVHLGEPDSMRETSSSYSHNSMDYPAARESPAEVLLPASLWTAWLDCCWTGLGVYGMECRIRKRLRRGEMRDSTKVKAKLSKNGGMDERGSGR